MNDGRINLESSIISIYYIALLGRKENTVNPRISAAAQIQIETNTPILSFLRYEIVCSKNRKFYFWKTLESYINFYFVIILYLATYLSTYLFTILIYYIKQNIY